MCVCSGRDYTYADAHRVDAHAVRSRYDELVRLRTDRRARSDLELHGHRSERARRYMRVSEAALGLHLRRDIGASPEVPHRDGRGVQRYPPGHGDRVGESGIVLELERKRPLRARLYRLNRPLARTHRRGLVDVVEQDRTVT